jgi:hypothetical protein
MTLEQFLTYFSTETLHKMAFDVWKLAAVDDDGRVEFESESAREVYEILARARRQAAIARNEARINGV